MIHGESPVIQFWGLRDFHRSLEGILAPPCVSYLSRVVDALLERSFVALIGGLDNDLRLCHYLHAQPAPTLS